MHGRKGRSLFPLFILFPMGVLAGERLRIAIPAFPQTLNPVYATNETAQAVLNKVHQALFGFDEQGRIVNELTAEVTLDPSRLQAEIRLHRGIRFANGTELQAADVAATFRLLRDPAYGYPYRSDLDCLESVTALGRDRLLVRLRMPYAPWRISLTFKVLCAAEIAGRAPEAFRRSRPCGCGWYRIARVDAGRRITLTRNPYRIGPGLYPALEYSVLLDVRQTPWKLMAGEIDAGELFSEDVLSYARLTDWQEGFRLARFRKFGYLYLVFNLRRPAMDLALRRRICRPLVQGPFLDQFLGGNGERVHSPFLYLSDPPPPSFSGSGAGGGSRPLAVLCNSETPLRRNLVLFLCEEMKKAGVELVPRFLEYQLFLNQLKLGEFDLAVSGFLLDLDWNLRDVLAGDGVVNYAGYRSREMDSLLAAGLAEFDEGRRRELYLQAHRLWAQDLPFLPLFTGYSAMGIAPGVRIPARVSRLVGSTGDFFYNIQEWRR